MRVLSFSCQVTAEKEKLSKALEGEKVASTCY